MRRGVWDCPCILQVPAPALLTRSSPARQAQQRSMPMAFIHNGLYGCDRDLGLRSRSRHSRCSFRAPRKIHSEGCCLALGPSSSSKDRSIISIPGSAFVVPAVCFAASRSSIVCAPIREALRRLTIDSALHECFLSLPVCLCAPRKLLRVPNQICCEFTRFTSIK